MKNKERKLSSYGVTSFNYRRVAKDVILWPLKKTAGKNNKRLTGNNSSFDLYEFSATDLSDNSFFQDSLLLKHKHMKIWA